MRRTASSPLLQRSWRLFLASFIASFYWLWSKTWRVEHIDFPHDVQPRFPKLFAHWHGDELLLIRAYMRSRMAILASRSQDGELMKRILNWFGFRVVRGSSSRGGVGGLKGLIDVVDKESYNASLAVDGPHGPIYRVKPGILKLAQQTGVPIIPGAAAASRRFIFKKAWNRCYLPLPFSKCIIVYGKPIPIPQDASEEEFEKLRRALENQLLILKANAEERFARKFSLPAFSYAEPSGV